MADCSYARCIQERRFIKRELQKWTKNMVYIVGECLLIIFFIATTIFERETTNGHENPFYGHQTPHNSRL